MHLQFADVLIAIRANDCKTDGLAVELWRSVAGIIEFAQTSQRHATSAAVLCHHMCPCVVLQCRQPETLHALSLAHRQQRHQWRQWQRQRWRYLPL